MEKIFEILKIGIQISTDREIVQKVNISA